MSNFIDFLLVISKLQSPIYRRSPQLELCKSRREDTGGDREEGLHTRTQREQKKCLDVAGADRAHLPQANEQQTTTIC